MKIGALDKALCELRDDQREEIARAVAVCVNLLPEQLVQEMGLRTLRDLITLIRDRIARERKNREGDNGRE